MATKEELETQISGPLSAALITVATFSLTVMGLVKTPSASFVDEVFMLLGLSSLLSGARIIDYMIDKVALDVTDRIKLFGGGYLLFAVVVGGMSFAILLLYVSRVAGAEFPRITMVPAGLVWLCITCMLMSQRGSEAWLVGAVVGAVLFVLSRFVPLSAFAV